jgi:uncharacterized protein with PQ loop repeat
MHHTALHHKLRIKKKKNSFIDKLIFVLAFVSPLSVIPQIVRIYTTRQAQEISFITWIAFAVLPLPWIWYGIVHRQKPIIVNNVLWVFFATIVIVGKLLFR